MGRSAVEDSPCIPFPISGTVHHHSPAPVATPPTEQRGDPASLVLVFRSVVPSRSYRGPMAAPRPHRPIPPFSFYTHAGCCCALSDKRPAQLEAKRAVQEEKRSTRSLRSMPMEPSHGGFLVGCLLLILHPLARAAPVNFSQHFQPYWAPDHISLSGDGAEPLHLALDNASGCGFASRKTYLFGQVGIQIKLVEGDSAGTVTAFYMASAGANHDELDFEFLGNVSGEPYLLQTNVYVNGTGNREQRHSLWFDPTTDFHSYTVFWNRYHIRFLVDGIPIRVFTNKEASGVPYPKGQAMGIYGSVWNADDWATQGGRVKTNWSHAPFVTAFRSFDIDACEAAAPEAADEAGGCGGEGRQAWWDAPGMSGPSPHQRRQLKWARAKHLVYDYCKDVARFAQLPGECLG